MTDTTTLAPPASAVARSKASLADVQANDKVVEVYLGR